MTTLNIMPASDVKYKVTDEGKIELTLKDTANVYADGSNPIKTFTITTTGNTVDDLNNALALATEDAIDYFTTEAEKIQRRLLLETGMNTVSIPDIIFTGDSSSYVKTIKSASEDGIIIKDSIYLTPANNEIDSNIFMVQALVMGPSENRRAAQNVAVLWNKDSGTAHLKELLIDAYSQLITPAYITLQTAINEEIGIDIPTTSD